MFDIVTLRFIWWALIGVLLMGFAITDGFDFGSAILMPFVAKTEEERLVLLDTVIPVWEGNQVWIILSAGALFAAWPLAYAITFSGFYLLVLFLLLTMGIARPVSFKYRNKVDNLTWRRFWDKVIFCGGFFPAMIFGILIGNIIQGVPFNFDPLLTLTYTGHLVSLFNPFALLCGATSVAMLTMHGGLWIAVKTEGTLLHRAFNSARLMAALLILLFALGGLIISQKLGYQVVNGGDPAGASNPLHKEVITYTGAWLRNYFYYPYTVGCPILGFFGALGVMATADSRSAKFAFFCSSISIIGVIATVGVSLFPFLLPSSSTPSASLLVWDASSSQLTLLLMLVSVVIFLPIISLYTSWVYKILGGKVTLSSFQHSHQHKQE